MKNVFSKISSIIGPNLKLKIFIFWVGISLFVPLYVNYQYAKSDYEEAQRAVRAARMDYNFWEKEFKKQVKESKEANRKPTGASEMVEVLDELRSIESGAYENEELHERKFNKSRIVLISYTSIFFACLFLAHSRKT